MLGKLAGGRSTSACVDVRRYPIDAAMGILTGARAAACGGGECVVPVNNAGVENNNCRRMRRHRGRGGGLFSAAVLT